MFGVDPEPFLGEASAVRPVAESVLPEKCGRYSETEKASVSPGKLTEDDKIKLVNLQEQSEGHAFCNFREGTSSCPCLFNIICSQFMPIPVNSPSELVQMARAFGFRTNIPAHCRRVPWAKKVQQKRIAAGAPVDPETGLRPYDGRKARVPSWTDRVLWRSFPDADAWLISEIYFKKYMVEPC